MEFAELESFIYNNPTIDDFPTFIKSLSSFIPQVGYEDFSLVIEAFLDNQLLHNGHGFSLPMKINDKLYHFSILKMTHEHWYSIFWAFIIISIIYVDLSVMQTILIGKQQFIVLSTMYLLQPLPV